MVRDLESKEALLFLPSWASKWSPVTFFNLNGSRTRGERKFACITVLVLSGCHPRFKKTHL